MKNKIDNIHKTAAIVLNGEVFNGEIVGDIIVGVDGGYDKAENADVFVGDKDSVSKQITTKEQIILNVDKDMTDGEYAVRYILEQGYGAINFYGVTGGRLDHILANLGLMALCLQNNVKAVAYCNDCNIYFVKDVLEIDVKKNVTVSLSPFSDRVHIISLEGVKWELANQTIYKNSSMTISNVSIENKIRLCVDYGVVMVIVNK